MVVGPIPQAARVVESEPSGPFRPGRPPLGSCSTPSRITPALSPRIYRFPARTSRRRFSREARPSAYF